MRIHGSDVILNDKDMKLLKGDHLGCVKPPVGMKTKVPFHYVAIILKRNLCFGLTRPEWSPCILVQGLGVTGLL